MPPGCRAADPPATPDISCHIFPMQRAPAPPLSRAQRPKPLGSIMTLWNELARATLAGDEILLRQRGATYEIRFNGVELMSNVHNRSEQLLAERTLYALAMPAPRVLIGGLGMGFTLRAALDALGPKARITVCELVPEIVDWNRGALAHLAGGPLNDPRVEVCTGDVMEVVKARPGLYDAVLMDTDNGPDIAVREENAVIYEDPGLRHVYRALCPGGVAAFWSATQSPAFERRLNILPWTWKREDIQLIGGRSDAFHHIYFASDDADAIGLRQAG